jgi:hypothetical protein
MIALAPASASAAPAAAQQKSSLPQTARDADIDYPVAYVCSNTQYTQVDDKPGTCTADKTPLTRIRLGIAYKCLHGPANIQAGPGQCNVDHQPKGPVTVSAYWTCKGNGHYLDPGKCADGTARDIAFEERPHGDHNPRHGGLAIFMSADLFHHVEGTYVAPGIFRLYFYNEFTKPMKVGAITGRVVVANSNAQATGKEIPLTLSPIRDGNAVEAKIPDAPLPSKGSIVYLKALVKLKPGDKDWVTDYTFADYSKDPAPPAPATAAPTTTGAAKSSQQGPGVKAPATAGRSTQPATTPGTTARAATPKPALAPSAPAVTPPPAADAAPPAANTPSNTAMAGGAEVSGGATGLVVVLPEKTPDLLAFLKQNAGSVADLLNEGQLGAMWNPALTAKDAALALQESHLQGLNDAQKARLASAAKQLTVLAWQIDAAGDLGNREQLGSLTSQFQTAVTDILSVYGQS